jgi:membrane protein
MKPKIKNSLSFYWKILKSSVERFFGYDILTQSAALSYYMVFSLPPMLLVIFWTAGLWYEEILVREAVFDEFGDLIGKQGAMQLMSTLEKLSATKPTFWAAVLGVGTLLFTASTVFVSMKQALNKIFEVQLTRTVKQGIGWLLLDRFLSIAMLCIIAIILTISMVVSALITAFGETIEKWLGDSTIWLLLFDHIILNVVALTLLFAITYRYMPDSRLKWKDTWFGAFFTALLFLAGESLIELFIGKSQLASYYDAAGGLLVLMLWVYYTSAIFLFGALVTHFRSKMKQVQYQSS